MVPVIETKRLRLRGHALADFDSSAAMWANPEVTRYIGGKPSTREESWRRFMTFPGMWTLLGYGYWLFEEKDSGAYVGEGGFAHFKRDVGVHALDAPEHGWALTPAMHGKGYAFEAATAQLAWAEKHFGRSDFVCLIAPQNAASLKLADSLGYREFARTAYKGDPTILLRRA